MNLRPYQVDSTERVAAAWTRRPDRGAMMVLPTGCGKTITGLSIVVQHALEHGHRALWLAHRNELIDQPARELLKYWPAHGLRAGIIRANRDAPDARMVFGSAQTLALSRRLSRYLAHGYPRLLAVDECHHSVSPTYRELIASLRGPDTLLLGLTATPDREDGADLGDLWDIVSVYDIVAAIRDGWLVQPYAAVRRLPELDPTQFTGRRDYTDAEAAAALLKAHVIENTVTAMSETHVAGRLPVPDATKLVSLRDRHVLVFTATVEQARLTSEALCAAGWRAGWVCGETPAAARADLLQRFQRGHLNVLCNAGVLTEGTDLPRCNAIVLARPFQSRSLLLQCLGRGLRLFDAGWDRSWGLCNALDPRYRGDADCIVVDLVSATEEHSIIAAPVLIGDETCDHDWVERLDGSGVCSKCERRIACYAAKGPHKFGPDGICTVCGAEQCEMNPDSNSHAWVRQPDHTRVCAWCEAVSRDPLAGLVDRHAKGDGDLAAIRDLVERQIEPTDDTALMRLPIVPETWAVDLGAHGILCLSGDRAAGTWCPTMIADPAAPIRLASAPVPGWYAWAIAKDLVRRTRPRQDMRGRAVYGGHETVTDREAARKRACDWAIQAGLGRLVKVGT